MAESPPAKGIDRMDIDQVRNYVDGELSPEETTEFERSLDADESLRAMVVFEESLRGGVAKQLLESAPRAPADVREAVIAAMAGAAVGAGSASASAPASRESVVGRIFAGPTRANFLAVAACLLIVAGAVVVGMFGDEWGLGLRGTANSGPAEEFDRANMASAAQHAGMEHRAAMGQAALLPATIYRTPEEIDANLSDLLGIPVPVFDLSTVGLTLLGGVACALPPAPDSSVQLVYVEGVPDRASPARGLCVFMQPDTGQFGNLENVLITGRVYTPADMQACMGESVSIFSDGRTVYIVRASYPGLHQAGHAIVLRSVAAAAGG
jgi:hypothetical protein